ncbi:hypothetical protein [Asanoa iriomotensis]|uniref:CopG family transcriptional regulator n=1 Tax=Asanoa iriomotensis TaxID=234613 RepID=A0ABQ4C8X0_9ACTN|nr:hypothetical protein [Asanoa iriomotensis]GIF58765.1 hypothetical protein Air01nite_48600 [Asanoa iriomotensis]
MANRTFYLPDGAEPVYGRAQAIAADAGRSVSDVIVGLLALYVHAHDCGPTAPAGVEVYRQAERRARTALADLAAQPGGSCDGCGDPATRTGVSFDLTAADHPMTITRSCESCAAVSA